MSEHQSTLGPGRIQFHQWCQPPIEPGDYTVTVHQEVDELGTEGEYTNEFKFSVAGPRFSLNPSEVYAVYPPKGEIGDFANTLPHVIFTRRTLPWERSLDPAAARKKDDTLPWMTLLVFSASDFADGAFPEVTSRKVGELLTPSDPDESVEPKSEERDPAAGKSEDGKGENGVVGPAFNTGNLAAYELLDDLCNTIDIPMELFRKVAPSRKDLAYLAHVREVNTGAKETLSYLADGWFSVVLANRFPEPRQPFATEDFTDVPRLVKILKAQASPLALYLWDKFDKESKKALNQDGADHRSTLVKEFNRIVRGPSIYPEKRFADVQLSEETRKLVQDTAPQGSDVIRLNRLLLEDAYPGAIAKRPDFGGDASAVVDQPLAIENKAFLVSLEGVTGYLPGGKLGENPEIAGENIRLAVLASWGFHCEEAFTFKASMHKLDVKRLCVPWDRPELRPPGSLEAKKQVHDAYARGYTALNHATRLGERTVSWYRGPLVPLYLTKQTNYEFRPAADAALRYDPLVGMMDVTYAGAFQLGRLLALQDRHFATSLYAYRTRVQRQLNDILSKKRLESVLGASTGGGQRDIMSAHLKTLDGSGGSSIANGWAASAPAIADPSADGDPGHALRLTADFDLTVPQNICRWLGRLMLLYRVPFAYLVPDERMLPTDSIRFFYLDPGWVKCLLEGACSVGRATSRDEQVDKELRDNFLEYAIQESRKVRTRSPETTAADDLALKELPATGVSWPQLTGFLLRSPVVEGWQGLEMRAWETWKDEWTDDPEYWEGKPEKERQDADADKEKSVLTPLRLDRLGLDIMLCIFDGKVNRIEIKQPPEGMHFGAAPSGDGKYTRFHLRRLDKTSPGDQIKNSKTPVVMRSKTTRVVDVVTFAGALEKNLSNMAKREKSTFTSAEFGVEMVESPGRAFFDVNYVDNDVKSNGGSK